MEYVINECYRLVPNAITQGNADVAELLLNRGFTLSKYNTMQ